MNAVRDEAVSAADQQVLDTVRPTLRGLQPAARRKLLAELARESLETDEAGVQLASEDGDVFAVIRPTPRQPLDLKSLFTPEEIENIKRNIFDESQHMTVSEILALTDSEDDRTGPAR